MPSGIITETSWDAVTIAWDNGQVARVNHGDMREIQQRPNETDRRYAHSSFAWQRVCELVIAPYGSMISSCAGQEAAATSAFDPILA